MHASTLTVLRLMEGEPLRAGADADGEVPALVADPVAADPVAAAPVAAA